VLDIARELPMTHPPGEGAAVSVPNTLLTRLVVEEATGEDFGDEVRTRLLEPLGLDDTTYGADSRRPDELLPGIRTEDYQVGGLQTSEPNTPAWTSVIDSPGWMASSVDDLIRWGNALYRTDDVIPSDLADRAEEVNDYGSAPIGIALTDDGVCVMLAECDNTAYDYVGFGQPSLAPGTYAGLFYDREIDSVIVVVANGTASIRPLYAAVRDTLTPG
jgi:CubicO group peptidase (beta-lactamase class C family)